MRILTPEELTTIRARADAATHGPWRAWRPRVYWSIRTATGEYVMEAHRLGGVRHTADAEFIAHARSDVPALLDEIARLRQELM